MLVINHLKYILENIQFHNRETFSYSTLESSYTQICILHEILTFDFYLVVTILVTHLINLSLMICQQQNDEC